MTFWTSRNQKDPLGNSGVIRNRANLLLPAARVPARWLCEQRWRCCTPTLRAPGAALPREEFPASRLITLDTALLLVRVCEGTLGSLPVACKAWLSQQAHAGCHLSLVLSSLLLRSACTRHMVQGRPFNEYREVSDLARTILVQNPWQLGESSSPGATHDAFASFGKESNFCMSACVPASDVRLFQLWCILSKIATRSFWRSTQPKPFLPRLPRAQPNKSVCKLLSRMDRAIWPLPISAFFVIAC